MINRAILFYFLYTISNSVLSQNEGHGVKFGFSRLGNPEHHFEMVNNQLFKREAYSLGGLLAGIYINQKVSDHFWVKHEILYINKGFKYQDTLLNGSMKTLKVNLHYLDFYPFLAAYNYKGFQIFAGPMASFLFGRRAAYLGKNDKIETEKNVSYEISDRNLMEAGIVAGIEYEIKQGINLGARYTKCLIATKYPSSDDLSCSSHTIAFVLGYTILKKKKEITIDY